MLTRYIRSLYNWVIRPYTPRKIAVFNGIAVRGVRLLDATDIFPNYEEPLIRAIRTRVDPGNDVVIVGGGRGVSSVAAAHRTGPSGSVSTYEGARDRAAFLKETVDLNKVSDTVDVNHAVVGEAKELAGEKGDALIVSPSDLPGCDILVLDCEGAEKEILAATDIDADVIIVETHGFLNSSEEVIRNLLSEQGYDIVNRSIEVEERGIYVLTAVNLTN